MNQVSSKLRRGGTAYYHWCPACEEMHHLPDGWKFDGNLESPTFAPSFKHSGIQPITDDETARIKAGQKITTRPYCCHYILTAGILNFSGDCTHAMAGKSVPLPPLPAEYNTDDGTRP